MTNLHEIFGAQGLLARTFEGFRPRVGQRRMAERIETALAQREILLVEAGTGTGKTFAYLVPALRSGLRVLISTGTRTLQDQLYARDLPLLSAALGRPVSVALLKGRANYLCRARLPGGTAQGNLLPTAGVAARVVAWAASTRSGDLAEVVELSEADPLRAQFASTRESCTGVRCAEFERCHVVAARRAALAADVVVVNHYLLLADLALKEDGFGELLPGVDALILDEAHQLPDLAAEFFGVSCSSRQLELLLADTRRELVAAGTASRRVSQLTSLLETPLSELAQSLGRAERRVAWAELPRAAREHCEQLQSALDAFAAGLQELEAGVEAEQCAVRARQMAVALAQIGASEADDGARAAVISARGFQLSLLPYDISVRFRALVKQRPSAWVFTSATLALASNFRTSPIDSGSAMPKLCVSIVRSTTKIRRCCICLRRCPILQRLITSRRC
jgi:ATP-dependent DNA helicase DinG